ncbi:MAG: 30S ribosomal protein S10 [bacterium]
MQGIRIKIKGFDSKVVEQASKQIVEVVLRSGAKITGPIPLPTKTKRWTVIKSPHIDKRGMETFELKTYIRLIDIVDATPKTIESLSHLELPAGVGIDIKS